MRVSAKCNHPTWNEQRLRRRSRQLSDDLWYWYGLFAHVGGKQINIQANEYEFIDQKDRWSTIIFYRSGDRKQSFLSHQHNRRAFNWILLEQDLHITVWASNSIKDSEIYFICHPTQSERPFQKSAGVIDSDWETIACSIWLPHWFIMIVVDGDIVVAQ